MLASSSSIRRFLLPRGPDRLAIILSSWSDCQTSAFSRTKDDDEQEDESSSYLLSILYPRVGKDVLQVAFWGILIAACVQPAKVLNSILGNGILPSGGDTKFVLAGHLIGSYLVGLPAAVLLGIFAGFNAWGVFGARAMEEIIKAITFLLRFRGPVWYQKSVDELSTAPK